MVLDKNQNKAIKFGIGPLLIIAGAGTGKTTVITQRIKYLLKKEKLQPHNILALTFTEKAASEMQERIDILMPYGYTDIWINTFHSFCDRVLRNEAHFIGLDPNYKLISQSESVLLLKTNIFELDLKFFKPLGNPTKFLDALLTHFSRLKDEDINPSKYLAWAGIKNKELRIKKRNDEKSEVRSEKLETAQYLELANAYRKYEEIKVQKSLMDFADLISNALLLFRRRSNVLKRYQEQFKFILVDEFQDTNFAQNELAILLSGKNQNITVVADDDQSIYRFRGAAISNVLQFKKNFEKAKIVTLINNYRSTQTILDSAYTLIQHNNPNRLEISENISKKLKSNSKKKDLAIRIIHQQRADDEADKIAQEITKLNKSIDYKDMAILVRANNHSQLITQALQRHKIPYQFLGPGYLFQQEEIKDLIAYIMLLTNLLDTVSLFRILSMDIFNISAIDLNYLLNFAKQKNMSLFESLNDLNQSFLKKETKKQLESFREMVKRHISLSKKETGGQILYYFLIDSGLFKTFQNAKSLKEEKKIQNVAKFFDRIKNFETERTDANIYTLSEWLNLMLSLEDSPTAADLDLRDQNAVNILTVHASKGLEFKIVFLVNLVSDRFPTRERSEKIPLPFELIKEKLIKETDFHLEEERRLFYVGMTRAKEVLYFTLADYYGNAKRIKKFSPFIYESLPGLINDNANKPSLKLASLAKIVLTYEQKQELKESKNPFKINYINYSNLQMFDICPLHFKAKVIYNIPTPKSFVQSFGISVHNTLYNFYKLVNENKTPTLKELREIFKNQWINEGYQNKKHEKEKFKEGLKILNNFYKHECIVPVRPLAIELPFTFFLKNGVKVSGKIDRIDQKSEGKIEIIDYKTGKDNPKADKAHRLQLAMYALAATSVKDKILNKNPQDITLTLYFLEDNAKKSMTFTKKDLDEFEKELIDKIKEIEGSNFECSKNVLCLNCEFKILCNV